MLQRIKKIMQNNKFVKPLENIQRKHKRLKQEINKIWRRKSINTLRFKGVYGAEIRIC